MFRPMTLTTLFLATAGFVPSPVRADPAREGAGGAAVLGYAPLSDDQAWARMPVEIHTGETLPSWARILASASPRRAAAMLHLDYVHRVKSPLDPKLRASMRWVAAHANHCAYSEAVALADARRAGLDDAAIDALIHGDPAKLPASEKAALEFARKMTVASSTVTDDEFAALVQAFGDTNTAAMVLMMAAANFQDRLFLCLGAPLEPNGALPPIDAVVTPIPNANDQNAQQQPRTAAAHSPLPKPTGQDLVEDDLEWIGVTYAELQERLERQRSRKTRVRIPTWEEVQKNRPANLPQRQNPRPTRVVWNLVCSGYQPELAAAWSGGGRNSSGESRGMQLDRIFSNSLFWVITRSINCPYCMGHCEMLLETAGLTKAEIAERTALLAGEDWSSFTPQEQHAFAFGRKLTRAPWTITSDDIKTLKNDFGQEQAFGVLWTSCWGNYMTRISNGFQLQLERDNVFADRFRSAAATEPAPRPAENPVK
jgi:alkylhydroperoxidase family enzyme